MGRTEVRRSVTIRAPLELVFDRITDHEAMAAWPGISWVRLVHEGHPRNGLGAIRRVRAGGFTLDEEVVSFERPHRFAYQIIKGLPVEHRGAVELTERDGQVTMDWRITMASGWPLLTRVLGLALGHGLDRALPYFKADTERRASQS